MKIKETELSVFANILFMLTAINYNSNRAVLTSQPLVSVLIFKFPVALIDSDYEP